MKVSLVSYTQAPEDVCDFASMTCVSQSMYGEYGMHPEHKSMKSAIRSGHLSVLEHANFTFYIEGISRACSHQLVRHRMASYAQQSQRYVSMEGFEYVTPKSIREGAEYTKIMDSQGDITLRTNTREQFDVIMAEINRLYSDLVDAGIPEEDARYILPNACCTNIVVTMNARELMLFFKYRTCNRAQWEIREMANEMLRLCKEVAPALFENAGPQCESLGYCPESKSCGKCPKYTEWKEKRSEGGL